MTLDQYYGLLDAIPRTKEEEEAASSSRMLREALVEDRVRVCPLSPTDG